MLLTYQNLYEVDFMWLVTWRTSVWHYPFKYSVWASHTKCVIRLPQGEYGEWPQSKARLKWLKLFILSQITVWNTMLYERSAVFALVPGQWSRPSPVMRVYFVFLTWMYVYVRSKQTSCLTVACLLQFPMALVQEKLGTIIHFHNLFFISAVPAADSSVWRCLWV